MNPFSWLRPRRRKTEMPQQQMKEPPIQVPRYDPDLVRVRQHERELRRRLLEHDKQVNRENIWRPDH